MPLDDSDRAFGIVCMADWRRRHPERWRELIREGLAHRETQQPGSTARRVASARAAAVAAGHFRGPSPEQVTQAEALLAAGLSMRRVSHTLGFCGNRVSIWVKQGLVSRAPRPLAKCGP